MQEEQVALSVIIIAHQRKEYLASAIESVLAQSLSRRFFEIIVVKDFEDSLVDELIRDSRCILLEESPEATAGQMFARGIEVAAGGIVCFLDDDDEFLPTKLDYVRRLFEQYPNVTLIHNEAVYVNSTGEELSGATSRAKRDNLIISPTSVGACTKALVACGIGFNSSSLSIRREELISRLESLRRIRINCDNFFGLLPLIKGHDVLCSSQVLTRYRVHPLNTSGEHVDESRSFIETRRGFYSAVLPDLDLQLAMASGTVAEDAIRHYSDYTRNLALVTVGPSVLGGRRARLSSLILNRQFPIVIRAYPLQYLLFLMIRVLWHLSPVGSQVTYFKTKLIASRNDFER